MRKALKLNPENDGLLIQLSCVQDKAGQPGESEKVLRELLQHDPENASALNRLGSFLLRRHESLPEAVRLLEQAVNIELLNEIILTASVGRTIKEAALKRRADNSKEPDSMRRATPQSMNISVMSSGIQVTCRKHDDSGKRRSSFQSKHRKSPG